MPMPSVEKLIPVLMTAIGPAILVSAVGMLLLTLTNRLGRVIDRSRTLAGQLLRATPGASRSLRAQLDVLWKRAGLIRLSIALASTSALCAAMLVTSLFLMVLFHLEYPWLIAILFISCLVALIGALAVFIRDINLSLVALSMETNEAWEAVEAAEAAARTNLED